MQIDLSLNVKKTKYMLFRKQKSTEIRELNLRISNDAIQSVNYYTGRFIKKINKNILNYCSYLQVHGEIRTQKKREKKIHQDVVYTT